jgi:hypothetical protein
LAAHQAYLTAGLSPRALARVREVFQFNATLLDRFLEGFSCVG